MPRYRLRPVGARNNKDDLTLEIEGDRTRLYNDEREIHNWGYVECVDYALPPGAGENSLNWAILIGRRIHEFGMSEAADAALNQFWARGYLIRNPDAGRAEVGPGLLWMAGGAGIFLLAAGLGVLAFFFAAQRGGGVIVWTGGLLFGGLLMLRGLLRTLGDPTWANLKNQMIAEGFEFGDESFPPAKIDIVTGRVRPG